MGLRPVEIESAKLEASVAESRSGSRSNSASSGCTSYASIASHSSPAMRGVIVGAPHKSHPRLTRRAPPERSARDGFQLCSPTGRHGPSKKERRGGLLRLSSAVLLHRLGDPQLRRRAVQHPVGLDAADAVTSATICWSPNGPTAIRATASRGSSPRSTAGSSTACPNAATSSCSARPAATSDFVKRVIGLPGDTIEVRGGMLVLNGRPIPREQPQARSRCRFQRQQPVQGRAAGATPMVSPADDGGTACLYPAYRETLPGRPRLPGHRPGR